VRRFHVRPEAIAGGRVTFDAGETRHLTRVLRLGPGDTVEALDGRGSLLTVRLDRVGARGAEGAVLARAALRSESPLFLTLVQGLAKGDKMESIIRMATELGVSRVVPVVTARTVVRVPPGGAGSRLARWQRVAREAAKQCGRAVIPEVMPPSSLHAWLGSRERDGLLVCLWEGAREGLPLPAPPVTRAALVVGPEGGLEAGEADSLAEAGAIIVSLGSRILRTETAGPAGLALLQARYGDLADTFALPK